MKIYFAPFSPYVRKCLVTAHELGLSERVQLLPANANPVQRDQELIAQNPLGQIPTFLTDEGTVLYDSRVICEYLDALGGGTLFPRSGAARWDTLTLAALGDGVLDAALLARYEDAARPEALRWAAWRAGQLDKAETALAHLGAHPALLAPGRVDIGTLTVACALGYLDVRFAEFDWRSRHAAVAQWYAEFSQRPSLRARWTL
ncbi:glutathione S-transferase [Verminephrobacter aporrectodeae subsp. tuberculatae]|uniref:glutathione S-transferase n=1 Tax=Verminephrobacter aporrectodeae TaxID=1110389 RepID=UPI0022431DA8|nr:glutathione S-transferase [Verminephrobacter aporrectodeae]MCW8208935.1 glutathione S-transferase [Verminephrobacter aporrectodeae subsp. tuberculatae]